jgi:hypothetical protein
VAGGIYGRGRSVTRGALRCTLTAACVALVSVAASSPALAQRAGRGQALASHFASPGKAKGLAVDETTGHVYVSLPAESCPPPAGPRSHSLGCVDELEVSSGSAKVVRTLQVPDPSALAVDNAVASPSHEDVYVSGTTRTLAKEGEEEEDKIVYKFGATGTTVVEKLTKAKVATPKGFKSPKFEPVIGLAVDPAGNLFVYEENGLVARFDNAAENESLFAAEAEFLSPSPGLAVNSKGSVYIGHTSEIEGTEGPEGIPSVIGKCEINEAEHECEGVAGQEELDRGPATAIAVNGANEVFVLDVVKSIKKTSLVGFTSEGAQIQQLAIPNIGEGDAIAANSSSNTIYVADASSDTVDVFEPEPPGAPHVDGLSACIAAGCNPAAPGVQLDAEVDPSGLATTVRFEYGTSPCGSSCEKQTEAIALGAEFGDQKVSVEPPDLQPGATYHFRVFVHNEKGEETSSQTTITIPGSGSPLPDKRQWEMVSPPEKHGFEVEPIVGPGGVIQSSVDGNAITYIADGPIHCEGEPEGSPHSPEPAQILAVRGSASWGCNDISTANSASIGTNIGQPREYQAFTPNLALSLVDPFPGPGEVSQWAVPPLAPPVSAAEKKRQKEEPRRREEGRSYQEKTVYLRDDAPLHPESLEEQNNYAAAKENGEKCITFSGCGGNAGFLALVTEENALAANMKAPTECAPETACAECEQATLCFGGGHQQDIEAVTATPDLSHVLIRSLKASPGLYEWSAGQLQLVSRLPKNAAGEELSAGAGAVPGGGSGARNPRHAISDDGMRVFWTNPGTSHLYLRDLENHETIQVDKPEGTTPAPEDLPDAVFQTASTDGSRVFFTDTQRLTPNSKSVNKKAVKPDLYVFEPNPPGSSSRKLTDLTGEPIFEETSGGEIVQAEPKGESGGIAGKVEGGGVIGASDDGTYIYFVANGALVKGATPGDCEPTKELERPQASCNLYEMHFVGEKWVTKLIAVLSSVDGPSWGASNFPGDLAFTTARVSPNGRFLAFMSSRSLTGYDNEDHTSKQPGERMDEEVFLYDANEGTLTCASCNPTGAQPLGVFDSPEQEGGPEGLGLVVDRLGIWGRNGKGTDHWLAGSVPGWTPVSIERALYQSRYLSNSGRLFFDSPDLLVPAVAKPYAEALKRYEEAIAKGEPATAPVSKNKVYEFEPTGVGDCKEPGGCIGLLSSNGEIEPGGEHESAFVDASATGDDVFFVTVGRLKAFNETTGDKDSNYDLYDARVCQPGKCFEGPPNGSAGCAGETECKQGSSGIPGTEMPASMTASASGNVAHISTLGIQESSKGKPKKLTKAQLLAKALATCRKKYKGHSHSKRKAREKCEVRARKKYGHASSHKKKKSHKASRGRHGAGR